MANIFIRRQRGEIYGHIVHTKNALQITHAYRLCGNTVWNGSSNIIEQHIFSFPVIAPLYFTAFNACHLHFLEELSTKVESKVPLSKVCVSFVSNISVNYAILIHE